MADSVSLDTKNDRHNKVSPQTPPKTSHVLTVTSGKGGVGKTSVTTNLGIALAMKGASVCIFDADSNESNVNALLGIIPGYAFEDYLEGGLTLDEVTIEGPRGIHIIPAASGITDLPSMDIGKRRMLTDAMRQLEQQYDYLLIDTGAGTGGTVLSLVESASHSLLVISPEPASMTDAYSTVKELHDRSYPGTVYLLVNMVSDRNNAMDVFRQFEQRIKDQLNIEIQYFGYIALDEAVISAMHIRQPVLTYEPGSPASKCFLSLANKMNSLLRSAQNEKLFFDYWQRITAQSHEQQFEGHNESQLTQQAITAEKQGYSLDYDALRSHALGLLNDSAEDPEEASLFVSSILDAYIRKYNRYPCDLKESLYNVLERMEFPQNEMHDIIVTLETLFEKRSRHPVHDYQDSIVKILAEIHGSEEKYHSLSERLQESYERQFDCLLYDARTEAINSLLSEDRTGENLLEFLQDIKSAYGQRYKKELEFSDIKIEEKLLSNVIRANQREIEDLADEFSRFTKRLNEIKIARQDLVDYLYNRSVDPDPDQEPK